MLTQVSYERKVEGRISHCVPHTIKRPLNVNVTERSFLSDMEELFGFGHRIQFISVERREHFALVTYKIDRPDKPELEDLLFETHWAIASSYMAKDHRMRVLEPDQEPEESAIEPESAAF